MSIPTTLWYTMEAVTVLAYLAGIGHALHAIKHVRTSQGAIAWAIALVMFPFISVPAYLILGRSKFQGYVASRRAGDLRINHIAQELWHRLADFRVELPDGGTGQLHQRALEELARFPASRGNAVRLLVDGPEAFAALFAEVERAERYLLVQFFIVHDDELGRALRDRLVARARAGVTVCFLYDEIGCHALPAAYLQFLRDAGCQVSAFNSTRGRRNRFQINFRNHRKITVVDGRVAFLGGLNAGDEYMGRSARFGPWRDTHVRLEGPAVHCGQLSFLEDWYWATGRIPDLDWQPRAAAGGDQRVLILPSGPADDLDTCELFFVEMIHAARRRLWITSPYFVPDAPVVTALQLAALRGVDVRILLPEKPDHLLVYLSAFSYLELMEHVGVKIYRYQPGFLHQKVLLVDDGISAVGTANLDNRSFRLNFEVTAVVGDRPFAAEVAAMLERDFAVSRQIAATELRARPFWFRVCVRVARLLSPMQ